MTWRVDRLDDIAGPLRVQAELLAETGAGVQYRFAAGPREGDAAVEGVVIVALM
jgi:hypothetical protein